MLFGQSLTTIDKENRIAIPASLAAMLTERVYITQGLDRNLLLIPESTFQILYKQLQGLNLADPQARLLLRMLLGTAFETRLDQAYYLELPDLLKEFAGIDKKAVLIGQGGYIEIWAPGIWSQQELSYQDVDADPERFSHFNIAFG